MSNQVLTLHDIEDCYRREHGMEAFARLIEQRVMARCIERDLPPPPEPPMRVFRDRGWKAPKEELSSIITYSRYEGMNYMWALCMAALGRAQTPQAMPTVFFQSIE